MTQFTTNLDPKSSPPDRPAPSHARAAAPIEPRKPPLLSAEKICVHLGLLLICTAFVLPLVWMASTSLKTQDTAMEYPPRLVPQTFQPENYWEVLTHPTFNFLRFARNTVIVAFLVVAGTVFSSALVAYGFAKVKFKGRGVMFAVMLATMMIPFPVTMVGVFSIFRFLSDHTPIQFSGTLKPLWVPAWFGSAFSIFMLRQFFITIPDELTEAARIDGCSEFGIFWKIVLPLSKPALSVVALFSFLWAWNAFIEPLIYIQRPEQYTLALGLASFQSQHGGTPFNLLMAASMLVIAPVILLFLLTQRTFIQGIATTGMKG